ncbi:pullulanase [Planomicrobium chinense]|uniref:Pullulanase n=1 Tax=Planococcus glaciei TaxID=459472 RepID=A0A7H8QAM8_9BACL|nr:MULTISPECIES: DUF6509 family protein [Planococcus]ETP70164.1 hypothetical protein G159_03015 [Planococcus glaciei CHR43]KOF11024.1 pullulanase [Planococcus glaciei]MBX0315726.1 pullulanase [Planococcus glaciei]MBZ5200736.1 pullulanase [Planococcus chinensis]QDY45487.1 pullulanase [Planococcus glaciei]
MEITNFGFNQLKDPTGIIEGERYEFLLDVEVEEDDELFTEGGLELRVILAVEGDGARIAHYNFADKMSREVLEFGLEEDEEAEVLAFCKDKL